MKGVRRPRAPRPSRSRELAALRARLMEAEETLHAIQSGGVDALVVSGRHGPQVYTLDGAEHAYRVLIESMNEGALTLTSGGVVLYANERFARMVNRPLEQIIGSTLRSWLAAADRARLQLHLRRTPGVGSRLQVLLDSGDGSQLPAQISIKPLPRGVSRGAKFTMVVTDMTETRQSEKRLRVLAHRLEQAQESDRGRVALELTDNITQPLIVLLFQLQALVAKLPADEAPPRGELGKFSELLGQTAEEVERISRTLQPSILKNLGLVAALHAASEEFMKRTGVRIDLSCVRLSPLPPPEAKLALYRIFEEALRNIGKHARAHHVTARLTQRGAFAQLSIKDDGIGFNLDRVLGERMEVDGFGLMRMHERVSFLGGVLTIVSARPAGTEIRVRIPLSQGNRLTV